MVTVVFQDEYIGNFLDVDDEGLVVRQQASSGH